MAPQEIAEVRPRLASSAGQMLGGLARSDQRAARELYVRTRATRGNPTAAMTCHFLAIRAKSASRRITRGANRSFPACWLLAEWPPEAGEPAGYWLSTLPEDTPSKNSSAWRRSDGGSITTTAS